MINKSSQCLPLVYNLMSFSLTERLTYDPRNLLKCRFHAPLFFISFTVIHNVFSFFLPPDFSFLVMADVCYFFFVPCPTTGNVPSFINLFRHFLCCLLFLVLVYQLCQGCLFCVCVCFFWFIHLLTALFSYFFPSFYFFSLSISLFLYLSLYS